MNSEHLALMLAEMIDCGREFQRRTRLGQRYGSPNLQKRTQRKLAKAPIGPILWCRSRVPGGHQPRVDYMPVTVLSVTKWGIGDPGQWHWSRQTAWLVAVASCASTDWLSAVLGQIPLRGGCHHEVLGAGRAACDYVGAGCNFRWRPSSLSAFSTRHLKALQQRLMDQVGRVLCRISIGQSLWSDVGNAIFAVRRPYLGAVGRKFPEYRAMTNQGAHRSARPPCVPSVLRPHHLRGDAPVQQWPVWCDSSPQPDIGEDQPARVPCAAGRQLQRARLRSKWRTPTP